MRTIIVEFVSAVLIPLIVAGKYDHYVDSSKIQDNSFPMGLIIYGRNLTCGNHKPRNFFSETWTCMDMRVNGVRLAYGYYPGIGDDNKCSETNGNNDIAEVCRSALTSIGVKKRLWSAYVNEASCDWLDDRRVMLNMTLGSDTRNSPLTYVWEDMNHGYGWIHTLNCMVVR